ncbi:gap junction beta-5 protein-like [Hypanus sabinus]|uniref:gap junction beta-5 protein-like n=1 Tax=Hypanus sabinus TaxID=79690 RepID=UPI0028C4E596|nr:gap junction beta-5 protein-like [Hypanus sabinus]
MDLHMDMIPPLSGIQLPASSFGSSCLAALFVVRVFTMIVTAKTIWKDDLDDLFCNSTQVGCSRECYTEFSVLSPFNFFALQTVFVTTLLICKKNLRRYHISNQTACNYLSMLSRILTEGMFLVLWHVIYPSLLRKSAFNCDIFPCEPTVVCTMLGNRQKNAFSVFMYICSLACILMCVIEMFTLAKKNIRSLNYIQVF